MSLKKLSKPILLLLISGGVFLVLSVVFMMAREMFDTSGYDRFDIVETSISSDKESYRVGDAIELRLQLKSRDPQDIRLFEKRLESIFLSVSPKDFANFKKLVEYKGPPFAWALKDEKALADKGPIEKIRIDINNPYEIVVKGIIRKDSDAGRIIFDFQEYGEFIMLGNENTFNIVVWLRPIHPHPLDSLEDFTNTIKITVTE